MGGIFYPQIGWITGILYLDLPIRLHPLPLSTVFLTWLKADRNRGGGGWSKLSIRHFTALLCCNKVWRTHHPLSLYYTQWCNCNLHILNRFHTFHATNARHCHCNSALKPFFLIKVRSWFKRLFFCVFNLHTFSQKIQIQNTCNIFQTGMNPRIRKICTCFFFI